MAATVRSRAASRGASSDPAATSSQMDALLKKLRAENGTVASTWLAVLDLTPADQVTETLKKAVSNVHIPTPAAVKENTQVVDQYMLLWVKFSTEMRREIPDSARLQFELLSQNRHLSTNAYFYSSWAHVESSWGNWSGARQVLMLGLERHASPTKQLQMALQRLPAEGAVYESALSSLSPLSPLLFSEHSSLFILSPHDAHPRLILLSDLLQLNPNPPLRPPSFTSPPSSRRQAPPRS